MPDDWFEAEPHPHLIGSRCSSCGSFAFPPETFACRNPACGAPSPETVPLSTTGTIWSYAVNHYPPPPPGLADGPYAVAAVHLAREQMVVLGRIADGVDLDSLSVEQDVEIVIEPIVPGEEQTWKWRPRP
jgi:uncharacterized OB-fold protein